ncbi:SDR family NAD(P)-dependent oxidoreductase [Sphaerisporangium fuscum]|uniref:SDR family NAD(P)-dependent oxidoreductase n=1 Tax=Sphaerisporangium fuscum TaxID=2835868 RepID=UPI0027E3B048|nr:SDR family NAD(P)-dependent oxidoreductase [Sphaerisporangium fuscum]
MSGGRSRTALEAVAGVDLTGREAIVTGGSGGIGYETARALAAAGARVVIAGRDRARGEAAAAKLTADANGGPVVFRHLDLASLASVTGWADRHNATGKPCHILVANAAVMAPPLTRTEDGFELQFGTNHLGHFAFAVGLLPSMLRADGARVVVLSSSAHRRSDVDFDDPNYTARPYDPWEAYGQSKTANALFAVAFHDRYAPSGITANAVMPGAIATGLQRHMSQEERTARGWPNAEWKTAEQGAATSVWAATAPELSGVGGRYLEDCAVARPWHGDGPPPRGHYLPYALDPARAARLWALSEGLLQTAGEPVHGRRGVGGQPWGD